MNATPETKESKPVTGTHAATTGGAFLGWLAHFILKNKYGVIFTENDIFMIAAGSSIVAGVAHELVGILIHKLRSL